MRPIQVCIGYDPRQPVAFQVAAHSVYKNTSAPVSITRLDLRYLPIKRRGLTEFTYSRFLTPYLSGFEGQSIFLDSDVLVRGDVVELIGCAMAYPWMPVCVVKHQGARRFEQPSVMVFNNASCINLTPEYIDNPAHSLFKFEWARDVGELPKEWNHLVGYDAPNPNAKLVHFTAGIPIWKETKGCEFADDWMQTAKQSMESVSFEALMGRSVHIPMQNAALQKVC